MTDGLAPAFHANGELEHTEIQAPHGTASVSIDQTKHIMRIFCDPNVHEGDWEFICSLLGHMSLADIGEPDYLKGVDVFTIQLRT